MEDMHPRNLTSQRARQPLSYLSRVLYLLLAFNVAPSVAGETMLTGGMPFKWQINVVKESIDPTGMKASEHTITEYHQKEINKLLGSNLVYKPLGIKCEMHFEPGANSWEKMNMKSLPGQTPWYSEELNFWCVIDNRITVTATQGVSCMQSIGKNSEILPDENHIDISIAGKGSFAIHAFCGPK